jgi:formylmethanofuran:tetrahydromethanopterin formyltransferase
MRLNGVEIEDTFAEAFTMRAARLTVTAINENGLIMRLWLRPVLPRR